MKQLKQLTINEFEGHIKAMNCRVHHSSKTVITQNKLTFYGYLLVAGCRSSARKNGSTKQRKLIKMTKYFFKFVKN